MSRLIPIVIGFQINGWNVYRSLRSRGVRPLVFDSEPDSVFWKCGGADLVFTPRLAGSQLIDAINSNTLPGRQYVIISGNEDSVRTLSEQRDRLHPRIRLTFPEQAKVRMLLDKSEFHAYAVERGFRISPMYRLSNWDTAEVERQAQFPCILKTASKMYIAGMQKAYRIQGPEQLRETVKYLASLDGLNPENLMIQEWVPGGDGDVIFCMQYYSATGEPLISFVGRKIRQWRPETGGTSSAEPYPDEEAASEATRFFTGLGMRGICSMEFKRSSADGRLYMIEPTVGRANYQEGVATANGINIPYAAYCHAAGKVYRQVRPPSRPVKWVNAGSDFASASWYVGQGRLTWGAWLRSLQGRRAYAIFCKEEPWPFIELIRRKAENRIRRVWK